MMAKAILSLLVAGIGLGSLGAASSQATPEFTIHKAFLNLPAKNKAPKQRVKLLVDRQVAREFEVALAITGAPVRFDRLEVHELQSAWPQQAEARKQKQY